MKREELADFITAINKLGKFSHSRDTFGKIPRVEFFVMNLIDAYCQSGKNGSEGGVTVTALAQTLEMPKAAVSKLLRTIETKGYIERRSCSKDRRVVYICLSEDGKRLISAAKKKAEDKFMIIFEKLGCEDSDELLRILNRLFKIIQEENVNQASK